jgi:predicted nucleic acid-binding protein
MIDLNVLLDVLQQRAPHFECRASVLDLVAQKQVEAYVPAIAMTTLFYILRKSLADDRCRETIAWLLDTFRVAACSASTLREANVLPLHDFEDAVVSSAARETGCEVIVTRNTPDFLESPIEALTPARFLETRTQ